MRSIKLSVPCYDCAGPGVGGMLALSLAAQGSLMDASVSVDQLELSGDAASVAVSSTTLMRATVHVNRSLFTVGPPGITPLSLAINANNASDVSVLVTNCSVDASA